MMAEAGQLAENKMRNSRTSTRKVRTGCLTCKKRHIKCDETKPHCLNCLRSRGECEGYIIIPRKKRAEAVPGQLTLNLRRIAQAASPTMQLRLDLDALDFADAKSQLYFHEFVHLTQQPWVSAASHSELWEVTFPQLTRNNSTLRQAAMAIGALSMWHRQSGHKSLRSTRAPVVSTNPMDAHFFHALTYYSRSLKLQSDDNTIQNAIFLSILLLVFETLRGNRAAALDHVNHGLALLVSMVADEDADRHIANLSPNPKPILGEVADVFNHLSNQARSILGGRVGQSLPLPHFTQGLKANQQTLRTFTLRVAQLAPRIDILDRIPAVFSDLGETERFIAATNQRQRQLSGIMLEIVQASGVLTTVDQAEIKRFWISFPSHPRLVQFSSETGRLSRALNAAFSPLFDRIVISDADPVAITKAFHLRLQIMDLKLFNSPGQHIDLEQLQAQAPFYREYLALVDMGLRAAKNGGENPAHQLSLSSCLAERLFVISFTCRDPVVREDALWKLKDYPGYDGLWNPRALYVLALRNRSIEKANMVEGSPLEQWQRLWRREFVFEDGGSRITLRYLEKDDTGQWGLVEETTTLGDSDDDVQWVRQPPSFSGTTFMAQLIPHD